MISSKSTIESIGPETLVGRAGELRKDGWRLSAISCARMGEKLELVYSFDRDYQLLNLRMELPGAEPSVPSISSHYFCAVLYENEMHDLFGLRVEGMAVDFKGNLYKTAVKYPFGSTKPPQVTTTLATTTSATTVPAAAAGTSTATSKS